MTPFKIGQSQAEDYRKYVTRELVVQKQLVDELGLKPE
jgi:hypothetical protein